jgi:hypothetical protein
MSAQNEIIAVAVDAENVVVNPNTITDAQLIEQEWDRDEEDAMSILLNTIRYYESYMGYEDMEKFALPNEDDEIPYVVVAELMRDMLNSNWGKRTTNRMRREVAGVPEKIKLTQQEKAEHPDYLFCECCVDYFQKDYYKKVHILTKKHRENEIARTMRRTNDKKKMADGKIVYSAKMIADGMDRLVAGMKAKEPELVEEQIETSDSDVEVEDDECVYVIKTWGMEGEYTGLLDIGSPQYKKEFKTEEEARWWLYAMTKEGGQDTYSAMTLIKIDPTKNEDRETIIEEWEDGIYESEDEV